MKNIGLITSEEDYLYRYSVDKNNINYNGERYKSYYIKVDCLEEERIKANNVESVVIDSKEFESYDGEPGPDITIIKATGVEITPSKDITLNLADSKTYKLEANVYPENASNKGVIWQCADNKVAIVDQNGNVEAKGPGTTEIKVITRDGEFTDICKVTVVESENNEPGGDNNNPGEGNTDPDTPGGDNNKPGEGNTEPDTPGGDNNKPGEGNTDPDTPGGDNNKPGSGDTETDTPSGDNSKPGSGDTETDTPGGDNNNPGEGNTDPDTPGGDNNEQGDDNTIIVKPGENNNNSSNNQNGSNNQNNESNSIPTTGQESYMWLIAIILIAVGAGLTVYKKKKKI
nr:Ig-like domain-containing protein [Clostridium sp. NSJ-49]